MVRKSLSRTITEQYKDETGLILVITIDPVIENQMCAAIQQDVDGISLSLPTEIVMDLSRKIAQAWKVAMDEGKDKVILLCDSRIRSSLAKMLTRTVPLPPLVSLEILQLSK